MGDLYFNQGGDFIYTYLIKYDNKDTIYQLPIPPDEMITTVNTNNKIYETTGLGEINILKDIGLREITMNIYLPNDITLPFVQNKYAHNCIIDKPIVYLSLFRRLKAEKKPFRLMITRILPNGDEIFQGNIEVSLEKYYVYERGGEEGDFFVELNFKEYREAQTVEIVELGNGNYATEVSRVEKETPKTYTVVSGDTLWSIAKRELNNELLYTEIAQLNNITEPRKLQIGTVLKLP